MNENKGFWHSTILGTFWTILATYSGKVIVFVSTIVLARLLLKEDFGVAGYALSVMAFLTVVNDFGLRAALIYFPIDKKMNTVAFILNLTIGIVLVGLTWIFAPSLGAFFNDDRAVSVTRVLALTLPILALGNVNDAILQKRMEFSKKAIPDTIKLASKGIISIVFAFLGFGYWSLIIGQLFGSLIWVLVIWWVMPWSMELDFDFKKTGPFIRYSLSVFFVAALSRIFSNADYIFVGRYLGAEALGIYTLAFRLPEILIQEIPVMLGNVLFPAFSKISSFADQIEKNNLLVIRYTSLITVPIGIGLAFISEPLILVVFSEKWIESVPVMALISIQMLLVSLGFNFGMVYKATGRPEILSRLVLVRVALLIPALWWASSQLGTITAVAAVHAAVGAMMLVMDVIAAIYLQNLRLWAILEAFLPSVRASIFLVPALWGVNNLMDGFSPILHLIMAVFVGIIVYTGVLYIFEKETVLMMGGRVGTVLRKARAS